MDARNERQLLSTLKSIDRTLNHIEKLLKEKNYIDGNALSEAITSNTDGFNFQSIRDTHQECEPSN